MCKEGSQLTAAELFGQLDVPKRGRERLLAIAIELFYRQGFNAIGIDHVIAEAGVSKTTFYKHFQSKTELMVAAIQWRDHYERRSWDHAVRLLAGNDPRRQLRAYFEVMDRWFNDPMFNGCLFLNAMAEFPNPHDPVHKASAAHKQATRAHIERLAEQAGALDPSGFTDIYITLLEGTLVMRHSYSRDDAAEKALVMVDQLIDNQIPLKPAKAKREKAAALA